MTKTAKTKADLTALLRARCTLFVISTREEVRVERATIEAASDAGYETWFWDCATGVTDGEGKAKFAEMQDPNALMKKIRDDKQRRVYVCRDLHKWLDPIVTRNVRSLARTLQGAPRSEARAIVLIQPSSEIPPELAGSAVVIDWPLPERSEIATLLDDVLGALPKEFAEKALADGTRDAAIDAAVGLTAEEAATCFSRSLVTTRTVDPQVVAAEKKRVVEREGVLSWYDPDPRGLEAVGGLDTLKSWLRTRRSALSQRAREFGLPAPKGCLLVGVPGCGKSLSAKAVAGAWGLPLLRLDLGALRSKYVGDSEANVRKALKVAEAVSPCVLWLDEIEKSLAGGTGPQGDGGVAADALGAVLSWMQERSGSVFVVATANDVSNLPPELLRKGRFDELFFVDLPSPRERAEVLAATIRQHGRDPETIELEIVAEATDGFSGAEVAALVPDALFVAFNDGERAITTGDLVQAANGVCPLSRTASERLNALREWSQGRARNASAVQVEASRVGRALDI